MLLRRQKYEYTMVYKRRSEMYLANTLSRAISGEPENQMTHKELIFCTELEQVGEMVSLRN